jgi:hypothetical protein
MTGNVKADLTGTDNDDFQWLNSPILPLD